MPGAEVLWVYMMIELWFAFFYILLLLCLSKLRYIIHYSTSVTDLQQNGG